MRRIALHGRYDCDRAAARLQGVLAVCVVVTIAGARPCSAQRSTVYRPSLTGPSTNLQRNFARVGGWLGSGGFGTGVFSSPSPSPSPASADLSNPLRQRRDPRFYRRPGLGQSGMDLGYGLGAVQSAPLIWPGRAFDPLAASRAQPLRPTPVNGALARAYQETSLSQRRLVSHLATRSKLVTNDYLDWVPAGAGSISSLPTVGRDVTVLTDPVVDVAETRESLPAPTQTLEQLVSNHVATLRRSYMERGWRSVKAGDYLDGLRMFSWPRRRRTTIPRSRPTPGWRWSTPRWPPGNFDRPSAAWSGWSRTNGRIGEACAGDGAIPGPFSAFSKSME